MKLVAIGGGHGTAVSLRALRRLSDDVVGIVSVADNGGSTGRLRAMLDVAAVGDLRKCLVALADPANPLTQSFDHRFAVGELAGHAVGNLLLVGMLDATENNLVDAVRSIANVMGVTGQLFPASIEGVTLVGRADGELTVGQKEVGEVRGLDRIELIPPTVASPIEAVEEIERADVILIGPGSLFTSVLAAAVVPGVTQALAGTSGLKVYVANLRQQLPETHGFSLQDHINALLRHGINPDVVLIDEHSLFATQSCSLDVHISDISTANGMAHDVAKLSNAVTDILERFRPLNT
jgi:uncharacterized cofD-like protein